MIIYERSNRHLKGDLVRRIDGMAAQFDRRVHSLSTGLAEQGPDLGSPRIHAVEKPVVAVPAGPGISSGQLGEIRHFFDYILDYPLSVFDVDQLKRFPLNDYTVLVMPEGRFEAWSDLDWERIHNWIRDGGRLIVLGTAADMISDMEGIDIAMQSPVSSADRGSKDLQSYGSMPYDE